MKRILIISVWCLMATLECLADNTVGLTLESFSMEAGIQKDIAVGLNNPNGDITAVQFDIDLPKGITVSLDQDGGYMLNHTSGISHELSVGLSSSGLYRVLSYSEENATYPRGSYSLLSLCLEASVTVAPGTYEVRLKNIILTSTDAFNIKRCADVTVSVEVVNESYQPDFRNPKFYGTPLTIKSGKEADLCINISDWESDVTGFSCDICLPDSIVVQQDEEGELAIELTQSAPGHTLITKKVSDGVYRLLCYSEENSVMPVSDAQLLSLRLFAQHYLGPCSKTIRLKDIVLSHTDAFKTTRMEAEVSVTVLEQDYYTISYLMADTLYYQEKHPCCDTLTLCPDPVWEGHKFSGWSGFPDNGIMPAQNVEISGYLYLPGDVNGDELINVKDISGVIRIILGTDRNLHNLAADVNDDASVDVVDVSSIGYYILNDEFPRPKASAMGYAEAAPAFLRMDDFCMSPGEEKQVNLYLVQNGNGITSMQFDLRLPDGITLQDDEDCIMANKAENPKHNVMWNRQPDGSIRIVDYSSANKTFSDGEHVLTLTLVADADMEEDTSHILSMDNVIMSTSDFKRQTSTAQSIVTIGSDTDATSVSTIRSNTSRSQGIYDVLGRKLDKPVKGINIIDGKKVMIK